MIDAALLGAGAGIAADELRARAKQGARKPGDNFHEQAWFERWEEEHAILHRIEGLLKDIAINTKAEITDKPITNTIVLQPGVLIRYQTYGRLYTLIFAAAAVQVLFNVPGVGNATLNLNAGWNVINLPDGTEIGLPQSAANNVNLIFRATNIMYGSAI